MPNLQRSITLHVRSFNLYMHGPFTFSHTCDGWISAKLRSNHLALLLGWPEWAWATHTCNFMATNSYFNYCASSASLDLTISPHFFVAGTKLNPYEKEIIFGEATNALFAEPKSETTLTQVPALSLFSLIRAREAASSFSLIKENKKLWATRNWHLLRIS